MSRPDETTPAKEARASAVAAPKARSRRGRWLRRLAIGTALAVVFWTVFGFFGVPLIMRHVVLPRVEDRLAGTITLSDVSFNPFTLGMELREAALLDESGRTIAGFSQFNGDLQVISTIFNRGLWFGAAELREPTVLFELDEERALNMASILLPSSESTTSSEPLRAIPRVVIEGLRVDDASIRLRDLGFDPPFERALTELAFEVTRLDTEPTHENPHTLRARLGPDAMLEWEGTTYIDPLTAAGTVRIDGLDLAPFSPYGRASTGLDLSEGRLSISLRYSIAPVRTGQRLAIDIDEAKLEGVRIAGDDRTMVEAGAIEITGANGDLDRSEIVIDRLAIRELTTTVRREADGRLEAGRIVGEALATRTRASDRGIEEASRQSLDSIQFPLQKLLTGLRYVAEDVGEQWTIELTALEMTDSAGRWEDEATRESVAIDLTEVAVRAGPIRSSDGFRTTLTLEASVGDDGRARFEGVLDPGAGAIDGTLSASNLALVGAAAYLPERLPAPIDDAGLASAMAGLEGKLVASATDDTFELRWDGRTELNAVEFARGDGGPLAFGGLAIEGVLEGTAPADRSSVDAEWNGTVELGDLALDAAFGERPVTLALDRLDAAGTLALTTDGAAPGVRWSGDATITGLDAASPTDAPLRARLAEGRLAGSRVDWSDAALDIQAESLEFASPEVEAVRAAPGGVDDGSAVSGSPDALADPPSESGTAMPLRVRLARLGVESGAFSVEDRSTDPPLSLDGEALSVALLGIDTDGDSPIDVEIRTRISDVGAVSIDGVMDPFRELPFIDLQITMNDVPMSPFTPAVGPKLGYAIERGRLSVVLPVSLREGLVDAQIGATLNSFHLGESVASEEATSLPIKFGLDLLRDSDDVIRADIGVSGDTRSPSFSYADLVWQAIFNLFAKIATSPFELLGALVGGDQDVDISRIVFEPGSDRIEPDELEKIELLGRALGERPSLAISIVGETAASDATALRDLEFDRLLDERTSAGASEAEAIAALFRERFPDAAATAVPVPPGRRDQALPAPAAMRERLLEAIEIDESALQALASARAERVARVLVTDGGVDESRARVVDAAGASDSEGDEESAPRVRFEMLVDG